MRKSPSPSLPTSRRLSRRRFLSALGVVGGGVVTAPAFARKPKDRRADPSWPAVAALFGELADGARVERWRVVAVHGVVHGAIPVVMETEGGVRFQVDVLRRDGAGDEAVIARTRALALSLSNAGDGQAGTVEEHGLGAMALARALALREAGGAPLPALLTLAERLARHPGGRFRVV
jgi:hypothetical protein